MYKINGLQVLNKNRFTSNTSKDEGNRNNSNVKTSENVSIQIYRYIYVPILINKNIKLNDHNI